MVAVKYIHQIQQEFSAQLNSKADKVNWSIVELSMGDDEKSYESREQV